MPAIAGEGTAATTSGGAAKAAEATAVTSSVGAAGSASKAVENKSSHTSVVDAFAVAKRIGPQPLSSIYAAVAPYTSSGSSVLSINFDSEANLESYVIRVLKKNGRRVTLVLDAKTLSVISRK